MDEKDYNPIDIQKIFKDIDAEKLNEAKKRLMQVKPPKIETMQFLLNSLKIDREIAYPDMFLRNYIYTTIIVRKHFQEITSRQQKISERMRKVDDKGSYLFKKLQYFYERNQSAKDEIVSFISCELSNHVANTMIPFNDLIDRAQKQDMWLLGPTYDYQYNAQFYDPEYDFSTYVKFYQIPGANPLYFLKNIEQRIALKKDNPNDYYREIIGVVDDNDMVSLMSSRVEANYHIHARKEIFETLATLFEEKRYLAFITMASIQLEGIFYELVCIKFGKKERQGTLVEKVEKAFRNNPVLMQRLYPYFAFDIPELRNEVAHKGFVEGRDLKLTAYELVLDLNCVLYFTEKASTDKFTKFFLIYKKLRAVKKTEDPTVYKTKICKCLFNELYMSKIIQYEFFWDVLTAPENFDDEMDYYCPKDLGEDKYCLKDIVHRISDLIKSDIFWSVVLSICNHILSSENSFSKEVVQVIELLKNSFIGILDGSAKRDCCSVNAKIPAIKEKLGKS